MKRLLISFRHYYRQIIQSIAFYPVIICIGFLLLAFTMINVDALEISFHLKKKISFLLITDVETARTMLSTLIGGIFSLTVFSFSMVMVVLSQSSSNFSPRLLPNLISNKKNQVILGMYIGTLLYSLVTLMNVKSYDSIDNSIALSVLLGVSLGVTCTGLFVYFIHTISQEIQIQNIIDRIYEETVRELEKNLDTKNDASNSENTIDFSGESFYILSDKTGYYKGFSKELLKDIIKDEAIKIKILPTKNDYVYANQQIIRFNKELSKEQLKDFNNLLFIESSLHGIDDYFSNMVKLMEVAVRGMSPGVNDPETAKSVIHKLGIISNLVFQLKKQHVLKCNNASIAFKEIDYDNIINSVFQPIRQYAKHDFTVMKTLIVTLANILNNSEITSEGKQAIQKELDALFQEAKEHINNKKDYENLTNACNFN